MSGFPLLFCCSSIESTFIGSVGALWPSWRLMPVIRNRAEQIRDVVATLNDDEAKLLTSQIEKMEGISAK